MSHTEAATAKASKERWRKRLRTRLESVDPAFARAAAAQVALRLLQLPEIVRAHRVLTCLSFGVELDTWHLLERLLALGKVVYIPRADPRDRKLHVHRYPCALRTLEFGLQQPPRGTAEVPEEQISGTLEAALVLGLGFDRRGYRLGYGSGYFDRFLAGRPFPAVGLALAAQVEDELPAEPHDVPMTVLVTETEVLRP